MEAKHYPSALKGARARARDAPSMCDKFLCLRFSVRSHVPLYSFFGMMGELLFLVGSHSTVFRQLDSEHNCTLYSLMLRNHP